MVVSLLSWWISGNYGVFMLLLVGNQSSQSYDIISIFDGLKLKFSQYLEKCFNTFCEERDSSSMSASTINPPLIEY